MASSDMEARLTAGPSRSPWQLDAKHVISAGRTPSKAANELLRNFGKLSEGPEKRESGDGRDASSQPSAQPHHAAGRALSLPQLLEKTLLRHTCREGVAQVSTFAFTTPGENLTTAHLPRRSRTGEHFHFHNSWRKPYYGTPAEKESHRENLTTAHLPRRSRTGEHFRFHNSWRKPYYGTPAEKESHRKNIRLILQEQMAERMQMQRESFRDRKQESEFAVQHDRQCLTDDALNHRKRAEYLQHFRDENKKLMEWKWDQMRQQRQRQDQLDREIMKYNPINWSGSLK
uniref:Uncharacterized protein n=1 Tax=Branchiostoma floridae TaxID=7739 RepID=C3ZWK7_BRAFL|eukprot:XP_002587065.1 hypothetical protein BRAFLDRAFT_102983 [Branchiostoma floridae]